MNFAKRQIFKSLNVVKTILNLDENTHKWNELRNKFQGKRAFMIGNGPSLNETPLYLLKDEYTLCFNRFYLLHERLNWYPYFYMCVDPEVLPDIGDDINANLDNYKYAFFHSLHSSKIQNNENVYKMHHLIQVPYFSNRLPLFGSGGTVAYAGLQMLFYMGFSEVILIGVDQNYVIHQTAKTTSGIKIESQHDDDPNHFDPRYFGKGRKYHQPVVATQVRMIKAFQKAKDVSEKLGIKVKNAGIGGNLEVYERVKFDELFNYSRNEIYSLFCSTIVPECSVAKVQSFIETTSLQENISESVEDEIFLTDLATAKKLIPKLVTRYLPYGPIENKYIFIRRDVKDSIVKEYFI